MRVIKCCVVLCMLLAAVSACAEVTVVSTYPQNGAIDVDPTIEKMRVRFSEAVSPRGYSFVNTDQGKPVPFAGKPALSEGNKLCTIAMKLEPGTAYAVSINHAQFQGFRSEAGGVSVTPYLLKFSTSGKKEELTAGKWQEDLAYLASELPRSHKNLFAKVSEKDWRDKVQSLNDRIPAMSEPEILVGLKTLFAPIGDQHTDISVLESDKLSVLPLVFGWFKDGIFVVAASDACKNTLGCQVVKIGDTDIDQACNAVSSLFAHDNDSARKKLAPQFLAAPDFLKSVALIAKTDGVALTLKDKGGKAFTVTVRSVKNGSDHSLKSVLDDAGVPVPLCRTNRGQPYWADYVENGKLVYFQYNECRDSPDLPFAKMQLRVETLLAEHKDARLVIDLRNNGGGNSNILYPFIEALKGNTDLNRKGRIFVMIGRRTFSSAILNAARLQNETKAVLVGEPTGASPNGYGEVKTFKLPNSGLIVFYSTNYFKCSDKDVDAIVPDVVVEATFAEFASGQDPVLDAIVNYKAQ